MLDIQEIESKLTDLKYSVKNGEISGNAKGHDDLEHPFLQMMQQFIKDGKQTEFEKMFNEASEKSLSLAVALETILLLKRNQKIWRLVMSFLVVLSLLLKTKTVKTNVQNR